MFSKGVILIFLILGISSSIAHAIPHQNRAQNPCTDSEPPKKANPVLASSPSTKNTTTENGTGKSTVKGDTTTGGKEIGTNNTDNGKGSNQSNNKTDTAATDKGSKTANPQSNGKTNTAATDNGTNNNSTTNTGDAQTSLTLDQSVINQASKLNGLQPQQNATNGTAPSLTSTNNFINFCLGKTITNGQQVKTGSCNPIVMGDIASATNIPSGKFVSPKNLDTVQANTQFTLTAKFSNIELGQFTNADTNYFAAPQQINKQGNVIGHTHFVIEQVGSLTSTDVTDPTKFSFFKGIDSAAAADGTVSVAVTGGVPAGVYRLSSISTASNHQPALVGVAQHGSLEDAIYFTVTDNGNKGNNTGTGNNNNTTANNTGNNNNNTKSGTAATNTGAKGKGGKNGTGGATGTTNTTATDNNKSAAKSGNNGKKAGTILAAEQSPAPSPSPSPSPKKFTLDYRKE